MRSVNLIKAGKVNPDSVEILYTCTASCTQDILQGIFSKGKKKELENKRESTDFQVLFFVILIPT